MEKLLSIDVAHSEPLVSFDIALAKKNPQGMVLDFDNDEFRAFCQAAAPHLLDAAEGARLLVQSRWLDRGGYYDQAGMVIKYKDDLGAVNKALRHESSHYFDHMDGRPQNRILDAFSHIAMRSMPVSVPTGLILSGAYLHPEASDWVGFGSIVANGIPAAGFLSYWLRPGEMRARRVARTYRQYNPLRLSSARDFKI